MRQLKTFSLVLIGYTSLCACSKKEPEKMTTVTVKEYGTNKPIEGARLDFYDQNYAPPKPLRSILTDGNGQCQAPESYYENDFLTALAVTRENYWPKRSTPLYYTPEKNIFMDRLGQIQFKLTRINQYPPGGTMLIGCQGGQSFTWITDSYTSLGDSSFTCNVFAEQTDTITWEIMYTNPSVIVASGGPFVIPVNETTIPALEIKY